MTESPTAVMDCPDTTAGTVGETDGVGVADVAGTAGAFAACAPDVAAVVVRTAG